MSLLFPSRSFAPLGEESSFKSISIMLSFSRRCKGTEDLTLSRFEVVRRMVLTRGSCNMAPQGYCWVLLGALVCTPTGLE